MDPGSAIGSMPGYLVHPIKLLKQVNSSDHFLKTISDQMCVFHAYPLGSWHDNQPQISEAKSLTGFWPVPGPPLQISYYGASPHTARYTDGSDSTLPCCKCQWAPGIFTSHSRWQSLPFFSLRQQQSRKRGQKIVAKGKELAAACYLLPESDAGFPDFNRVGPVISFWIASGLLSYLHQKKNCVWPHHMLTSWTNSFTHGWGGGWYSHH